MTSEREFGDSPSETSFAGHLCVHCGMLTTQCKCTPESLAQKQYQSNLAFQQKVVERLDEIIRLLTQVIAADNTYADPIADSIEATEEG